MNSLFGNIRVLVLILGFGLVAPVVALAVIAGVF